MSKMRLRLSVCCALLLLCSLPCFAIESDEILRALAQISTELQTARRELLQAQESSHDAYVIAKRLRDEQVPRLTERLQKLSGSFNEYEQSVEGELRALRLVGYFATGTAVVAFVAALLALVAS